MTKSKEIIRQKLTKSKEIINLTLITRAVFIELWRKTFCKNGMER